MSRKRPITVYWILVPALAVAGGIVCYYTYQTALQVERLGEESIAQSTLFLVQDKVERVERQIIAADNAVFRSLDLDHPHHTLRRWRAAARDISPSVRAVLVLDPQLRVLSFAARVPNDELQATLAFFRQHVLPDLNLAELPLGRLKHLHGKRGGTSQLISYKAVIHRGIRLFLVAQHDIGYLKRTVFPSLFRNEKGKQLYNVLDEDNRRVFGPSLAHAGDYVVGRRFPTTLYGWRLQIAPKAAPLLQAKGRTRRYNEVALIGLSLGVILLSVVFLLYATNKERRLGALKSEFIANVSHELKTPLSAVRMFGELLLTNRVKDASKRHQYLEIICSETDRLTSLIENVLDFSALERGERRYEMQTSNLLDVVERAIDNFRHRFERGGHSVELRLEGRPPEVRIDQEAILLAVINLLDNAAKYGGQGPIEVVVTTLDKHAQLHVRDHGPGIPSDDLKRVFERFYRGQRNPSARGSGIGLSLVKHIAQDHGGNAWAGNADDGGAIVSLRIPLSISALEGTGETPTRASALDVVGMGTPR